MSLVQEIITKKKKRWKKIRGKYDGIGFIYHDNNIFSILLWEFNVVTHLYI